MKPNKQTNKAKTYQINSTKYLSDSEQAALKALLSTHNRSRDALLIEIALITGMRREELLNTMPSDLNDDKRSILVRGIKGSKDREIPLPDSTYTRLKAYLPSRVTEVTDEKYAHQIFPISIRRLTQIWHQYRPNKTKGFHCLRHTFAINLYKKTKDLKVVQTALGHVNIQNTMVYADYVYSTDELRKALVG